MAYDYPTAYDTTQLYDMLDANDAVPDTFTEQQCERLVELGGQRADARGETSAMEASAREVLIATDWTGFAGDEFGYDGGELNKFAFGVLEADVSSGKNATLFSQTQVVNQRWLNGDGRVTALTRYVDDDYEQSEAGEMWIPAGAEQYICLIELDVELVHGEETAADAM